jgi:hypothetical protein
MKAKRLSKTKSTAGPSPEDLRQLIDLSEEEEEALAQLQARLTGDQRRRFNQLVQKLDRNFITEKAEVVRDTLVEILRNRKTTPNTLLQRNLWSSLDAIALYLDQEGFTKLFKQAAPRLFKKERLDDPVLVGLERKLMLQFLGVQEPEAAELDLPREEFTELVALAEQWKTGKCGLPYISKASFTFKEFFSHFCGRPDKILEIHHSPQAKAGAAVIVGVANIVVLFFFWPVTILTVIVMVIIGCSGC